MEVWLTPQQIAAMRLSGMPTTDRRVRTWAEKNLAAVRNRCMLHFTVPLW